MLAWYTSYNHEQPFVIPAGGWINNMVSNDIVMQTSRILDVSSELVEHGLAYMGHVQVVDVGWE
ncbi:hypothetical protein CCP4SC76_5280002 [Gammaproteobacteria bacterium]